MDDNKISELFQKHPNILQGIWTMKSMWVGNGWQFGKRNITSVDFSYEGSKVAFRVVPPKSNKQAHIAICSDKIGERGSPLTKKEKDRNELKKFGFIDPLDKGSDWIWIISEETPRNSYRRFIRHALEMCKTKKDRRKKILSAR